MLQIVSDYEEKYRQNKILFWKYTPKTYAYIVSDSPIWACRPHDYWPNQAANILRACYLTSSADNWQHCLYHRIMFNLFWMSVIYFVYPRHACKHTVLVFFFVQMIVNYVFVYALVGYHISYRTDQYVVFISAWSTPQYVQSY